MKIFGYSYILPHLLLEFTFYFSLQILAKITLWYIYGCGKETQILEFKGSMRMGSGRVVQFPKAECKRL